MESSCCSSDSYKQFLDDFVSNHIDKLSSGDALPIRLVTFSLTHQEVEGETLDWVLQYLEKSNAPHLLALAIARKATDEILKYDLRSFQQPTDNEDEKPVIDANSLCREVFKRVHRICKDWKENFPNLGLPDTVPTTSEYAIKNTRRKMEDKHVIVKDLKVLFPSKVNQSYYAVFDGHGGLDASSYAAAHLHCQLVHHLKFNSDVEGALKDTFRKTDSMFVERAERERSRSGTTGVVSVIRDNMLYLAWLGDSQALLMKNGKPYKIMEPHKPDREDEKKRIEDLGGCVVWFGAWRVNGTLSVSRAIGDAEHKPYISGEADTMKTHLDGDEECIILACDGLWDVLQPEEVCSTIKQYIDSGSDLTTITHKLVVMAKEAGSNDNITALVVFLYPHHTSTNQSNKEDENKVSVESSEKTQEKTENSERKDCDGKTQEQNDTQEGKHHSTTDHITLGVNNLHIGESPKLAAKHSVGHTPTVEEPTSDRRSTKSSRKKRGSKTKKPRTGSSPPGTSPPPALSVTSGSKGQSLNSTQEFAKTNSLPSTLKTRRSLVGSPARRVKSLKDPATTREKTPTSESHRRQSTS
ncbi:protein phosphatase 1F-like [Glandiceps talaboti]